MLKEMCEINSASGDEERISDYIIKKLNCISGITVEKDKIGNIIVFKKGRKKPPETIMIAAHLDEVGLIVSSITEDGYIKFKTVGGIDKRLLLSKQVVIGDNNLPGVIGVKAIHIQSKDERKKTVDISDMYIDIGATDKENAKKYVSIGDYIYFNYKFEKFGERRIVSKALDDRVGCYLILKLLEMDFIYDMYFCFTVQEETGLRGAKVVSNRILPSISLVLETTSCFDLPEIETNLTNTKLGGGVAVSILDGGSYADNELRNYIVSLAETNGIKYQYKNTTFGGNDTGAIVTSGTGCRVISLSLPCRNLHSPSCVIDENDLDSAFELSKVFLENLEEII